jgi:hypothetical protein
VFFVQTADKVATDFLIRKGYTVHTSLDGRNAMTVYLDLLMLLNFLIDFLLLVCAERLAGFLPAFRRISLASLLGGFTAGFVYFRDFIF